MEFEYIIVQAGGKGTRMEYLTSNKPKALVPIKNLPMIFHLFKKYPDKKFIIIGDYKIDVLKSYLEVFAEVKYLVVDARGKQGTCAGINDALELIPNKEAFMLIWSDLVLSDDFTISITESNCIGLSKDFTCRWRYENGEFEEVPSENTGVAGLFIFKEKSIISDVPTSGEFVRWLKNKKIKFNIVSLNRTKEFGLLKEHEKIESDRCRPFNKLIIKEETIIKEGIDEQGQKLAVREKKWYKEVKKLGFNKIPEIYSFEPLEMEKIDGKNVFEYDFTYDQKKEILKNIIGNLKELHELGQATVDYFSIKEAYITKTFDRLNKIRDLVPYADKEVITINGRQCRNIFYSKEKLEKMFSNYSIEEFKLLHGDCTFSNIVLKEGIDPKLIDPRGYFGFVELYGDVAYDWAKLYYSIVGNYDQFNLKRFRININEDNINLEIDSNGWEDTEDYFFELIGENVRKEDIKLIHAIIWLSLTTYAWEDYDSICGAFYNGLYYLEEILK
ncbi:GTP:adenosylcobinamide-phosphate guanylyltransferase/tRNA A-37 threonylcarbamoyl transferase component Bud32 [Clostridium saccharoperbutylacetonicum]|uniref:Nucleoside-diphosphate-sugar pyrophosphorylase involved in lipopolysaccharide biosynthesis/translation initiation factor 2B, gamma/epsilon subunits n=1 Tax=Clostridium saccharoperbutylacetonicum N1-4(HMT) TaxID=931276 RepID=M1MK82_9CLOT|nr:NTP transferase domain-containing protein [Clostridium saccharoperbutylacetonicum]AGF58319.1 nucleoside-diphosphate-sugar pyrophosphorylase involved in lipopolysaccharide biosynthesis/translation initiation factor 2B, gamma/epsilon subunits [Clostridium saccharoperbutylacetonicum N1-4(HMT)]NRT60904.1 GTP:adenosylcobinamide-phosphate guanylyltransferase/tRNA A-37 threonylcarbamoyl transferase component Bud32 [Clostridium saccharoperbutylacetonicum]NSB24217.1 GTP:adenosylcobinamide-phosphate gu